MNNKLRHIYFAVRYGVWDCGTCPREVGDKFLEWYHRYYDGDYAYLHIGKYYIGVSY